MTVRSRIIGCGSYLPANVVTNDDLAKRVDTSDEWIVARTGIRQRHIAADGETTSDLAYEAAIKAMDHAGVTAEDIDLIIVATATPDNTFPATATKVQNRLGVTGFAFDVQAVCSGFVYGLTTADMYIRNGQAKTALLAALSGPQLHPKLVIAVDEDIDASDMRHVFWSMTTRSCAPVTARCWR